MTTPIADGGYPDPPVATTAVEPADLAARLAAGEPVRLLDVRDRDEIDEWRIEGPTITRTAIPYQRFLQAKVTDGVDELAAEVAGEGEILVVCGEGEASDFVAGLLEEHGYEAANLSGGMAAWARVYECVQLRTDPDVYQYRRPSSGCLAYMVVSGGEAAVVDPLRAFVDRYVADADARDATVVAALDTHVHADHVSGLRALSAATGATRYVPAAARERGLSYDVTPVSPGEDVHVGGTALTAVGLPGHTRAMTGFAVDGLLMTGDSVFVDGLARPDLPAGEAGAADLAGTLHETLTERLASLPDETVIAPGHYDDAGDLDASGAVTATLGEVRDRLPEFDLDRDAAVERLIGDLPPQPANFERIVAINLGRETADDETAFALELGPNNCAATPAGAD